jgi:hypothetical protein
LYVPGVQISQETFPGIVEFKKYDGGHLTQTYLSVHYLQIESHASQTPDEFLNLGKPVFSKQVTQLELELSGTKFPEHKVHAVALEQAKQLDIIEHGLQVVLSLLTL